MFVELRTYTFHPGKIAEYMELYMSVGMNIQLKYLDCPLGYYTSELGPLNQVVHIWGYKTLDERMTNRAKLKSDARWPDYVSKILPLIRTQESKILIPAPFFSPSAVEFKRR